MKKTIITLLLSTAITATAQQNDVAVKTGEFSGDWQSLSAWECPEWFKDAKFGIGVHNVMQRTATGMLDLCIMREAELTIGTKAISVTQRRMD